MPSRRKKRQEDKIRYEKRRTANKEKSVDNEERKAKNPKNITCLETSLSENRRCKSSFHFMSCPFHHPRLPPMMSAFMVAEIIFAIRKTGVINHKKLVKPVQVPSKRGGSFPAFEVHRSV
jgi:hypothetical protein